MDLESQLQQFGSEERNFSQEKLGVIQRVEIPFEYPVYFTHHVFDRHNKILPSLLFSYFVPPVKKVGIWMDQGLVEKMPSLVGEVQTVLQEWCGDHFVGEVGVFCGGEKAKNDLSIVEMMIDYLLRGHFCRYSVILAVGGGAFLDVAGFATSLFHRGIRLVRLPSTTLGQGDSGIGVKNGINYRGKKNLLGVFSPPSAVVNDFEFLRVLPKEMILDGIAEAIKVAIIKDAVFFQWLEDHTLSIRKNDFDTICYAVRYSALLHMDHIARGGDPFERGQGRPLDFGHWLAHHLEAESDFQVRHGEGVAIGLTVDSIYAAKIDLIQEKDAWRIACCLANCGLPIWHPLLDTMNREGEFLILEGLEDFREHLGGELSITLPQGIGKKVEVHTVNLQLMKDALSLAKIWHYKLNKRDNLR